MGKEIVLLCRKLHKTIVNVGGIQVDKDGAMLWSSGARTVRSRSVHGNIGHVGDEWFVLVGVYESTGELERRLRLVDGFLLDQGSGVGYTSK